MNTWLLGCLLWLSAGRYAPESSDKPSIAILGFTHAESEIAQLGSNYAPTLSEEVERIFINSQQFRIVNRKNFGDLEKEIRTQTLAGFVDSERIVERGRQLGAQYIVAGLVTQATVSEVNPQTAGKEAPDINYRIAEMTLSISLLNVATGEAVEKHVVSGQCNDPLCGLATETALNTCKNRIVKRIQTWVAETFPLTSVVERLEVGEGKNRKDLFLLINGGQRTLSNRKDFKVIEYEQIGEKRRERLLGKAKLERHEGADFSICKVVEGRERIESRAPSARLYVVSLAK